MFTTEGQEKEQLALIQKIRNDPWEFSKYVFTKDESDKKNPIKRFPYELDYIKLYMRVWEKENRIAVPKSRRMKMTWTNVVLHLWDAWFHIGRHEGIVSKKEEDANFLIQDRFKFIVENLDPVIPRHLLPRHEPKWCHLTFPEIHSKIQGFPQGEGQMRQFTLSNIMADEIAFWEQAEGSYSASLPTLEGGGRFTAVSSPAPGFFKRLCLDRFDDKDLAEQKEESTVEKRYPIEGVEMWKNKGNEFTIFQLHYTADPAKRSKEFKHGVKKGMSQKRYNQEYELQWETFAGHPVYSDFSSIFHGSKEKLYPHLGLPLLRGWDFGLTPACIICQLQGQTLVVFKEFVAVNMGTDRFSDIVLPECALEFPQWTDQKKDYLDFIDASGMFRKDTNEETNASVLAGKGLMCQAGAVSWEPRRRSVEKFLIRVHKAEPCFQVNLTECPMLIKGFNGGYRYPDSSMDLEPNKIRPLKDEHSHIHDALQMVTSRISQIMVRQRVNIPSPKYKQKY